MADPNSHFTFIPYTAPLTSPRLSPISTPIIAPKRETQATRNTMTATKKTMETEWKNAADMPAKDQAAPSSKAEPAPTTTTAAASPHANAAPPKVTELHAIGADGAFELLSLTNKGSDAIRTLKTLTITIDPRHFDDLTDDIFSMALAAFHPNRLEPQKKTHALKQVTINITGNVVFSRYTSIVVSPCASRNAPEAMQQLLTTKDAAKFGDLVNQTALEWHHATKAIVGALTAIRGVEKVKIMGPMEAECKKEIVACMTTKPGEETELDGTTTTTTAAPPASPAGSTCGTATVPSNSTVNTNTTTNNTTMEATNKRKASAMAPPPAPSEAHPRASKRTRRASSPEPSTTRASISPSTSTSSTLSSISSTILANPPSSTGLPPSLLTAPATILSLNDLSHAPAAGSSAVRLLAYPQTLDDLACVPAEDVGVPTRNIVEKRGVVAQERERKNRERRERAREREREQQRQKQQQKQKQEQRRMDGDRDGDRESGEGSAGSASANSSASANARKELGRLPGGIASMGWFDRTEGEGSVASVGKEEWVLPTGKGARVVVGGRIG